MSVVAEVKRIIAEEADGALRALHHLAQQVEHLAGGVKPASIEADLAAIEQRVSDRIDTALADARKRYEAAAATLEAMLEQLKAATAAPPAPTAQPAAASVSESTAAETQPQQ